MDEKRPIKYVRALYNFDRKHTDELSFKKDDIITVTQEFEGGWWEGTRDGRTGWFPSNYVVPAEEPSKGIASKDHVMSNSTQSADDEEDPDKIKECQNVILLHMIEGERIYIGEITNLINGFFKPLHIFVEKLPNKQRITDIRAILESIFAMQKNILSALEDVYNKVDGASYFRVGGVFMSFAPTIADLYETYASLHPYVVATLEKEKDLIKSLFDMSNFNFTLKNTKAQLRLPFDRLEKYPSLMIDLERYIEESHPDRGDIQRAVLVLKELSENCINIRKNKETELDILCGKIVGWQGERLSTFGEPHLTLRVQHDLAGECVMVAFPSWIFLLTLTEQVDVYRLQERISTDGLAVESGGDENNTLVLHCSHLSESLSLECVDGVTRDKALTSLRQLLPPDAMKLFSSSSSDSVFSYSASSSSSTSDDDDCVVEMRRVVAPQLPRHRHTYLTSDRQPLLSPPTAVRHPQFRHTLGSGSSSGVKGAQGNSLSDCIYKLSSTVSPKHTAARLTHHEPISCLRPAGPLVPKFGSVPRSNSPKSNKLTRKKSAEPTGTMLEDAMILQVIESYCASSRARNTLDLAKLRLSDSEVRIGACLGGGGGPHSNKLSAVGLPGRPSGTQARDSSDSGGSGGGTHGTTCAPAPASGPTSANETAFLTSFGLPLPAVSAVPATSPQPGSAQMALTGAGIPQAAAAAAAQRSHSFNRTPSTGMPQQMQPQQQAMGVRLPAGARGSGRGVGVAGSGGRKT